MTNGTPRAAWERVHLGRAAQLDAPFKAAIELPPGFMVKCVEGLAALGLSFDAASTTIAGTPEKAGEFEILVHGSVNDGARTLVFDLPVIPDPASLWNDVPSDREGEHARADNYAVESRASDGSRWVAASRRGRRHAHLGAYRDDAVHVITDAAGGWHVAAVADGAGSATFSRAGAAAATSTAAKSLASRFAAIGGGGQAGITKNWALQAMTGAATDAAIELEKLATREQRDIDVYATTLLLVATRKIDSGWQVLSFSIGDGAIVVFDSDSSEITPMSSADGGEFAGETRFLGRDVLSDGRENRRRLFTATVGSMTAAIAMTDGVTDAKFQTDRALEEVEAWTVFWNEFGKAATVSDDGQSLLDALAFSVRAEHDDRTIAIFLPFAQDEPEL